MVFSVGIGTDFAFTLCMSETNSTIVNQIDRPRLTVIGNGMAGYKFCERLVHYDAAKNFHIEVFGEEPYPAYDRVHLTSLFQNKTPNDLYLAKAEWYQKHGIILHTQNPVLKIDRKNKAVHTVKDEMIPYDYLVFATGSYAFVPEIPGNNQKGVFVYRTIEDVQRIKSYAQSKKSAAVLGGGLLGLEAAKALRDMGLHTHVIERADFLMPQQLDRGAAGVLQHEIGKMQIKVHTSRSTETIEKHEQEFLLRFHDGDCVAADMIVISTGIRARDELAKECGLRCGTHGGVMINAMLQSSDPNIYAIGECACFEGTVYGLVSPGYEMADVLAQRMAGEATEFKGGDQSARLKLMGVEVNHIGAGLQTGTQFVYQDRHIYRRCVLEHGKLIGAISVGAWSELLRVQEAVANTEVLTQISLDRFIQTGSLFIEDESLSWLDRLPATARICNCMNVTKGELVAAYVFGCTTADELSAKTGAATVCGSCRPQIEEIAGSQSTVAVNLISSRILLWISLGALFITSGLWLIPPISMAASVQSAMHSIDILWRVGFYKQVSGFTILSFSMIALIFSLRKRIKSFSFGRYSYWRVVHAAGGLLAMIMIPVHTGFRWGSNLNQWLLLSFIVFALIGTFAGIAASLETAQSETVKQLAFRFRPYLVYIHILLFLPVPVLLVFHILKIYYY